MAKPTAFVIEDDVNLALAFAEAIKAAEFEVEVIHDGLVAKQRLVEVLPALVILDLHVPNVTRNELLTFIQTDERLAHTRVIVASADALSADEMRGRADLVLLKPVGFRQLRDMAAWLRPGVSSDGNHKSRNATDGTL
jgi:two-component system, OmpR family, response regulator